MAQYIALLGNATVFDGGVMEKIKMVYLKQFQKVSLIRWDSDTDSVEKFTLMGTFLMGYGKMGFMRLMKQC